MGPHVDKHANQIGRPYLRIGSSLTAPSCRSPFKCRGAKVVKTCRWNPLEYRTIELRSRKFFSAGLNADRRQWLASVVLIEGEVFEMGARNAAAGNCATYRNN